MNQEELIEWGEQLKQWRNDGYRVDSSANSSNERELYVTPRRKYSVTFECISVSQVRLWLSHENGGYTSTPFRFQLDNAFEIEHFLDAYDMIRERMESLQYFGHMLTLGYNVVLGSYFNSRDSRIETGEVDTESIAVCLQNFDPQTFVKLWNRHTADEFIYFKVDPNDLLEYIKTKCLTELVNHARVAR